MATPYSDKISQTVPGASDSVAAPVIRKIGLSDLHDALRLAGRTSRPFRVTPLFCASSILFSGLCWPE